MVTMCYQRYQVLHDSMLCMLCIVTSAVCRELESEKRAQYLKDQRKNEKESLFAFLEARTLQTTVKLMFNS